MSTYKGGVSSFHADIIGDDRAGSRLTVVVMVCTFTFPRSKR